MAKYEDGTWGTVKVRGTKERQDAVWIKGELTRMSTDKDPANGVLDCTWQEIRSFEPNYKPTETKEGYNR